MDKLFSALYPYRMVLIAVLAIALIGLVISGCVYIYSLFVEKSQGKDEEHLAEALRTGKIEGNSNYDKARILRRAVSADGINPNPNSYFVLNDSGRDAYIRVFTLAGKPDNVKFATTFSPLLNYPDCKSSIFVQPMTDAESTKLLNKQVDILGGEKDAAIRDRDRNRIRTLNSQEADVVQWAKQIENDSNSFYKVSFLFALQAESLEKLDLVSDAFNTKAIEKNLTISCVYGMQPEAYVSMCPYNKKLNLLGIESVGLPIHLFDKYSLTALYNHTEEDFLHSKGVPIARNMTNGHPVTFDSRDNSHDGYTVIVAGRTGSGKSVLMKELIKMESYLGTRYAAIDSQSLGGHGEYYYVCHALGGTSYEISRTTSNILNPWDVDIETVQEELNGELREIEKLNLGNKINEVRDALMLIIQGKKSAAEFKLATYLERICADITQEMYDEDGIYDGQPDSVYMNGGGALGAGRVRKPMPTFHRAYAKAVKKNYGETRPAYREAYELFLAACKDYVRELYISEDGEVEFSNEEYEEIVPGDDGVKYYTPEGTNEMIPIIRVVGARPYYDGQSTVSINKDCRFTNFDISSLPEDDKYIARQIALLYITEHFIRKNSENQFKADKITVIFDEAHEQFKIPRALEMSDNAVRTARKKNVGFYFLTQIVKEFDLNENTRSIYKNATAKFIFKQDVADQEFLKNYLSISESQASRIVNQGGEIKGKDISKRRRGECCLIDNHRCCFIKVLYEPKYDWYICESDPEARIANRRKYGTIFKD